VKSALDISKDALHDLKMVISGSMQVLANEVY
jgi:hypothetical protein